MPISKRRSSGGKDALGVMSEDEIIASLPEYITRMFNEVGFAKWNKDYLPVLFLNPFFVCKPPDVRLQWQSYYDRFKKSNSMKMAHLVFWYGSDPNKPEFSMMGPNAILTYDQAAAKGLNKIPGKITKKINNGTSLTIQEDMFYYGLKDLEADRAAPKEERWERDDPTNDDGEGSHEGQKKEETETEYEFVLKNETSDSIQDPDSPPRKKRKKSEKTSKRRSVSRGRSKKQLPSSTTEIEDSGEGTPPLNLQPDANENEVAEDDMEAQEGEGELEAKKKIKRDDAKDAEGEKEVQEKEAGSATKKKKRRKSAKPKEEETVKEEEINSMTMKDQKSEDTAESEGAHVSDERTSPEGENQVAVSNQTDAEQTQQGAEQSIKEFEKNEEVAPEEKYDEGSALEGNDTGQADDDDEFVPDEETTKKKGDKAKRTRREEEPESKTSPKKQKNTKRKKHSEEAIPEPENGQNKKTGQPKLLKDSVHEAKLAKRREKDRLKRAQQKAQQEFEQNEEVLLPLMQKLKALAFAPYADINKEKILKTLAKMESHADEIVPSFIKIHKIGMLLKDVRKYLQNEEKQRGGDKSNTGEIADRIKSLGAVLKKNYHEKLPDVPKDFEAKATKPFVSSSASPGPANSEKPPQAPHESALKKSKEKPAPEDGKNKRVSLDSLAQRKESQQNPPLKKSFSIGSMMGSAASTSQQPSKSINKTSAAGNEKKRHGVPSWLYAPPKDETPQVGYRSSALELILTALDDLPPQVWARLRKTNGPNEEFGYDDIAQHIEQAIFQWTESPREPKGPNNKLGRSKLASNPYLKKREDLYWCKLHEIVGGLVGQPISPRETSDGANNEKKISKPLTDLAKKAFLQFAYKEAQDLVMLPTLTFYNSMEGREEHAVHPALKGT